ncbi:MAG: NAD(P)/FAD-dependent oxidoreductase, partial [Patescibacteria group bacterium]|nr:NAD(P)/FAD-dependent oxidoreductase [Patescibacteria group bacterium]
CYNYKVGSVYQETKKFMTKIVICGAGFGGSNLALDLEKRLRGDKNIQITLIDRQDYQLFNPALYEVATAEEELVSLNQLKHGIALPLRRLLVGRKIKFIQGQISSINRADRKVLVGSREVEFDYLVLALGSQTEYFKVQGAQQFSLPLKSLNDAFRIRNAVGFAVQAHQYDAQKPYVRLVVAGGGYAGVEIAAELAKLADILAWKNSHPREKIEVVVVEAANQLLPGFGDQASKDIHRRLLDLGVKIRLLSPIFKVERNFINLVDGQRLAYDVLIWTTGVRARDCFLDAACECNKRGQLLTDEYLRVSGQTHMFALGDMACTPSIAAAPATAQAAVAEAKYLAKALPVWMQNKKPAPFRPKSNPFIVSVGGKWGVFKSGGFYFTGFGPHLLRLGANIRYFAGLIGWLKAVRLVMFEEKIFSRND